MAKKIAIKKPRDIFTVKPGYLPANCIHCHPSLSPGEKDEYRCRFIGQWVNDKWVASTFPKPCGINDWRWCYYNPRQGSV